EALHDLVMGDRLAGVVAALALHRTLDAVSGAAERSVDGAAQLLRPAPDDGLIGALKRACPAMVGKLGGEMAVGRIVLGGDQNTAGVLVEAVHDPRPTDAADAREGVAAMIDQRVDERAGPVAGARVDNEAGRLGDDDDVEIL